MAAYALGLFAAVLGAMHDAAWIALVALVGMMTTTYMAHRTGRWYRSQMSGASTWSREWWPRRGLWLMIACEIPVFVAVGCLAFVSQPHPS